jgi:hypothetical protein
MTEASSLSVAPIAPGGEDRAQESHAPTLLLQLLTPAALLVKGIKSAALLDVPLDLDPLSSRLCV